MAAVAASSTAMAAVIASSTAMAAVAASSTAMAAVSASSTAMAAVIASSTARAALMGSNTIFQDKRNALYSMATSHWVKKVHTNQDSVPNANSYVATPTGLVFANLGTYTGKSDSTNMIHPNGTLAATKSDSTNPTSMNVVSAVSFNGATFTENGDGYVYTELWAPV